MSDILSHCYSLIESGDSAAIANQLKADGELCDSVSKRSSTLPSPLAALLPAGESIEQNRKQLVRRIAEHLAPEGLDQKLSDDIATLLYDSLRGKILAYVRYRMQDNNVLADGHAEKDDDFEKLRDWKGLLLILPEDGEGNEENSTNTEMNEGESGVADHLNDHEVHSELDEEVELYEPTDQDMLIALKVLKYKMRNDRLKSDAYSSVFTALKEDRENRERNTESDFNTTNGTKFKSSNGSNGAHTNGPTWKQVTGQYESKQSKPSQTAAAASRSRPGQRRNACYICRFNLVHPHPLYPSLCPQCAEFNIAGSIISLPTHLELYGKNCLVTGARINLGYHTTLRLLRCGARVIASSRYPWDAQSRYERESDSASFRNRLKIVGADFRSAKDAFVLVEQVKKQVMSEDWGGKLDILINNAAQTLTDSVDKEEKAVKKEEEFAGSAQRGGSLFIDCGGYRARVRGGGGGGPMKLVKGGKVEMAIEDKPDDKPSSETVAPTADTESTAITTYSASSWVQSLSDIPYEDVISAHSVNTFVPLILCRELLPLMGTSSPSSNNSRKPEAYIINVSSREGIFEHRPDHSHKDGHHVHTNMSKAGLNMITETEASVAWKDKKVAMNTVDPGYMSAAPEYSGPGRRRLPIGWEDGAARVLWPIAVGEREEKAVWGRFLKHFGVVGVDVGRGR